MTSTLEVGCRTLEALLGGSNVLLAFGDFKAKTKLDIFCMIKCPECGGLGKSVSGTQVGISKCWECQGTGKFKTTMPRIIRSVQVVLIMKHGEHYEHEGAEVGSHSSGTRYDDVKVFMYGQSIPGKSPSSNFLSPSTPVAVIELVPIPSKDDPRAMPTKKEFQEMFDAEAEME